MLLVSAHMAEPMSFSHIEHVFRESYSPLGSGTTEIPILRCTFGSLQISATIQSRSVQCRGQTEVAACFVDESLAHHVWEVQVRY